MTSAAGFYQAVKDALDAYNSGDYKDEKDSPKHMEKMAKAMKDYLEANLTITYTWAGVMPPAVPDPVLGFTATVKFTSFNLTSPQSLTGLATKVQIAIATGTITAPDGFTLPPGLFLSLPLVLPSVTEAAGAVQKSITDPMLTWLKTLINPTPLLGAHGSYTGSAIMTLIG